MDAGARSRNFTECEREILASLVEEYRDVILSKNTKAQNLKGKNEAWENIARKFNEENIAQSRTVKQLKDAWHNLRNRAKEKYRIDRLSVLKTGGGRPPSPDLPLNERLQALVRGQIEPHCNQYDDDSILDSSSTLDIIDDGGNNFTIQAIKFASEIDNVKKRKATEEVGELSLNSMAETSTRKLQETKGNDFKKVDPKMTDSDLTK